VVQYVDQQIPKRVNKVEFLLNAIFLRLIFAKQYDKINLFHIHTEKKFEYFANYKTFA
jgi:hypothetical protein